MKNTSNYILWTFLSILLVVSALIIFKTDQNAFLYTGFGWLVIIAVFVWKSHSEKRRLLAIYIGSIILAFFLAELFFYLKNPDINSNGLRVYEVSHENRDFVGVSPLRNSQIIDKFIYNDSVIFNVVQTVDSNGIRYTPGEASENAEHILFFGCSFTFGTGLNDNETLPYFFQNTSKGQYKSINMGFNSYGAHQTLGIIQGKHEEKTLQGQKPKAAFFTAITDHVFRGPRYIDESFGPKYSLNSNGKLVFEGIKQTNFEHRENRLRYHLSKSLVLRRILFGRRKATYSQIDFMVALVHQASVEFESRYGTPFYCLLWNEFGSEPGLYTTLLEKLTLKNIKVIEIDKILPDYNENLTQYLFHQDGHPNAYANQLIAEYLYKFLEQQNVNTDQ